MEEQEKIGITEFKIFLSENLEVDIDVDNISKQFSDEKKRLEEEFGQEVPAFYSNAKNYMLKNSVTIDSSGRIDVNVIKQVSQITKKEVEKQQTLNNELKKQEEQSKNIEEQSLIEFKEQLSQIDFDNLTARDWQWIADNAGRFLEEATDEDVGKTLNEIQEQTGIESKFSDFIILYKKHINGTETEQEQKAFNDMKKEFAKKLNTDENDLNDEEINEIFSDLCSFVGFKKDIEEQNDRKLTLEDIQKLKEAKSNSKIWLLIDEKTLLYQNQRLDEISELVEDLQGINQTEKNGTSSIKSNPKQGKTGKDIEDSETLDNNSASEMSFENELDALFDNMFAEMEDPAEAIEIDLNEEQVEQTLEDLPEDQPQPELADEEVQNEAMEELQDERQEVEEDIEEIEEEIQEEAKEEIPEEQYEAPTFEDEKTGLAGLFSRIANSRAVKAVTNLFKPKEEQKRLNAPANQRVEDGVRFTDYESNGSLLPATIQTRNFFRNFAINTVEAVTKFAKNISGRGKQDNQVINTPTVIKSESTKEQTEKTVTQEQQQTVEKTETFNDTNKWAVSNEAIQRQDAINKAQERNNLSHVAAPKQEELQSEEDKSFEEI